MFCGRSRMPSVVIVKNTTTAMRAMKMPFLPRSPRMLLNHRVNLLSGGLTSAPAAGDSVASALVQRCSDGVIERARLGDQKRVARCDLESGCDPHRRAQISADREDADGANESNRALGSQHPRYCVSQRFGIGTIRDRDRNRSAELFGGSDGEARQRVGARRPRQRIRRIFLRILPLSGRSRQDEGLVSSDRRPELDALPSSLETLTDVPATWAAFATEAGLAGPWRASDGTVAGFRTAVLAQRRGIRVLSRALAAALRITADLGLDLVVDPMTAGAVALHAQGAGPFERRAVVAGHTIRATDAD